LNEARHVLRNLMSYISNMIILKKALDEMGFDISVHQFFGGPGTNGTGKHPPELDELINCIKVITDASVIIKGIDNGLIDFPHIRSNGEEVLLCYLYGEEDILYWHNLTEGFKGRKNINEL
jgi:hypothetical protein